MQEKENNATIPAKKRGSPSGFENKQKKKSERRPSRILRFMKGYEESREHMEQSRILKRLFQEERLRLRLHRRTKSKLLSPLSSAFEAIKTSILTTRLSTYSLFFAPFGILLTLRYLVWPYLFEQGDASRSGGLIGIALCLLTLFLLSRRETVVEKCEQDGFLSYLLFEVLSIKPPHVSHENPLHFLIPLALGFGIGILACFVSPLLLLGILLLLLFFPALFKSPELGLMCVSLLLPFSPLLTHPTVWLLGLLLFTELSFFIKLFLGKRSFSFEPLDLFVLLFSLFCLFGGFFALGEETLSPLFHGAASFLLILLGYFLVANLLSSRRLVLRFCKNLVFSGSVLAFVGLLQAILGLAVPEWLDQNASYINGRITAFLHNPNVLACYLVLCLPLLFALLAEGRNGRGWRILSLLLLVSALVFTWTRGAWIALFMALLLFVLLAAKKPFRWFFGLGLLLPNLLLFAPDALAKRISSIFSIFEGTVDSSVYYRFKIWRSSLLLFYDNIFGGIGVSPENFQKSYLPYAVSGAEVAEHSHNLFLQIGIEMGVFALAAFLVVLIFALRKVLSPPSRDPMDLRYPMIGIGAFCSLFAMLIFGIFDYVLYDFRIFFLFFATLGLIRASGRLARGNSREAMRGPTDSDFAEAEVRLR